MQGSRGIKSVRLVDNGRAAFRAAAVYRAGKREWDELPFTMAVQAVIPARF